MHRFYFTALFAFVVTGISPTDYVVNLGTDSAVSTGGSGSSTSGDFRYVLNQILNNQAQAIGELSHTITFTVSEVALTALPPPINLFATNTIVIGNTMGSPTRIDGAGAYRPFFIRQGNVTLQNLTIQNGLAQGGNGGAGVGGGGMGGGGALFVDGATVTIVNTTFSSNGASAGRGGVINDTNYGGGGGLGGNGSPGGGGGGYSGNGGSGGGGGVADGGAGETGPGSGFGGGGGAIIGAVGGAGASTGTSTGGDGGSVAGYVFGGGGGSGGQTSGSGGNGGGSIPGSVNPDGLGGGGGYNGTDGNGGIGGGGGGGIIRGGSGFVFGGNGGDGAGGGGLGGGVGPSGPLYGNGGYGGGGGVFNGMGGFGGGGGAYGSTGTGYGEGGFGGGGGGGGGSGGGDSAFGGGGGGDGGGGSFGAGGVGGTNGGLTASSQPGGDGAALGGALFVNTGSILFQGTCSTTGSSVSANGGGGAFVGTDIFAVSGASLTFAPGDGNTVTLAGTIADDSLASIPSGSTWVAGMGSGAVLTMQGPGTLVLEGVNTYSGGTTVSAGRLSVNGQILGGISVSLGATLGGTGTIYGGGTINGTLSPGNSVGTITFDTSAGNLTLSSSSTTNIEIDSASHSEVVIAGSGSVALGGTVNVTQDSGSYSSSGQYEILSGSYTGTFNPTVTGGLPGYAFSLSYMAPYVYLLYEYTAPPSTPAIATAGLSGNALIVANYLNKYAPTSTLSSLSELSGGAVKQAMDSISPSRNSFGAYITQQTAFSLSALVSSHIDAIRSIDITAVESAEEEGSPLTAQLFADASDRVVRTRKRLDSGLVSGWVSGFGEYARQGAEAQNPSFSFLSEAALGGLEYQGVNRSAIGGALGYAHTHFNEDHNQGNGNISYYFGSLYANGMIGSFYISPAIWGFFDTLKNTRHISFSAFSEKAKADIFIWQLLPHLEIGYDNRISWGTITPFSALDWAFNWQRGYREQGAAPYNARESSAKSSMVRSETGVKFCEKWSWDWGAFLLREKISYAFQKPFKTGAVEASFVGMPSSFTVTAVNQTLNLADVAIDFTVVIGKEKPLSINLGYEGEVCKKYWSNQGMLTLKKGF